MARMRVVLFVLAALLLCAHGRPSLEEPFKIATAPGTKLVVTPLGLQYALSVGIPILEQKLQTITVPNQSFDKDSIEGEVTSIVCHNLQLQEVTANLVAGVGVALRVGKISLSCHANWNYQEKVWPHIPHGDGTVDITSTTTSMSATIAVSETGGHPSVHANSCSVDAHVDAHFSGGISGWILNLFKGKVESAIEGVINSKVSQAASDWVNGDANAILATFSTEIVMPDHKAKINFSIFSNPTTGADHFSAPLLGEFLPDSGTSDAPFQPGSLPDYDSAQPDHMVQLHLDEFVANTGSWVYWQSGFLNRTITNDMVPPESPVHLNTSSFEQLIPPLYKAYPDCLMQLRVCPTSSPLAKISPVFINVTDTVDFVVDVFDQSRGGVLVPNVFTITGVVLAAGKVTLQGNDKEFIAGELDFLSVTLSLKESQIGDFTVAVLQKIMNYVCADVAIPFVNKAISKGFPLPSVDGVSLTGATVAWHDGYVSVYSNVNYSPSKRTHRHPSVYLEQPPAMALM